MTTTKERLDQIWQDVIKNRANWCCEKCNKNFVVGDQGLHAHHIFGKESDGKSIRWEIGNGVALCLICHSDIKDQLNGTSVTVVLIGAETSKRKWIKYEIDESLKKGNGLLGVYIHKCPLFDWSTDRKGGNPFDTLYFNRNGRKEYLSEIYKTYDWI